MILNEKKILIKSYLISNIALSYDSTFKEEEETEREIEVSIDVI